MSDCKIVNAPIETNVNVNQNLKMSKRLVS